MGRVRAYTREDIAAVAALWQSIFRPGLAEVPESLREYFAAVFFGSPWYDEELPSWVYEDSAGRVVGFLGVLPRRMLWHGQPIRAAVATQLMVAPHASAGVAALELIKRYFAGPQDLAWTDGANDSAHKLWSRLGGEAAPLYCQEWLRVLRPAQAALRRLRGRKALAPLALAAQPFGRLIDSGLARLPLGPYRLPAPVAQGEEATVETLLRCLEQTNARRALRPVYDVPSLSWLLAMLQATRAHGSLRAVVVRSVFPEPLGWYLYYVRPGAEARVLQFGARDGAAGAVLDHLFDDARRQGAIAVNGPMEPHFQRELTDHQCRFACWSLGVLIHTRNKDLRHAIHRGDAFLTRLEGEWWLRFGGDRFDDRDRPTLPAGGSADPAGSAVTKPRLFRIAQ